MVFEIDKQTRCRLQKSKSNLEVFARFNARNNPTSIHSPPTVSTFGVRRLLVQLFICAWWVTNFPSSIIVFSSSSLFSFYFFDFIFTADFYSYNFSLSLKYSSFFVTFYCRFYQSWHWRVKKLLQNQNRQCFIIYFVVLGKIKKTLSENPSLLQYMAQEDFFTYDSRIFLE